ncbi:calcium-binding protein [Microvirga tunisiensis]|uniref:calcium-binding protein n=1 Tax=Microvirga tunisiensis TaxID=2108360 RepID=UPI0013874A29|nr:calcium-binding protein [Microvirga tunisiensis]
MEPLSIGDLKGKLIIEAEILLKQSFFMLGGGLAAGGAIAGAVRAGVIFRREITDGVESLWNQAFGENEAVQQNAVADTSDQDLAITTTLTEDGATQFVVTSNQAHHDQLTGNSDANVFMSQAGNDTLHGAGGDDILIGAAGADVLVGGDGSDTADYSGSSAGVVVNLETGTGAGGEAEGDQLISIEDVIGSAHADSLTGNGEANLLVGQGGADTLNGGAGEDVLVGGEGADVLDGGAGADLVDYSGSAAGVVVDLTTGTGQGGEAEGDTLTGLEHVIGSEHGDQITGTAEANALNGLAGDDVLIGGAGDDDLVGGEGADVLDGGAGFDTVYYTASDAGVVIDLSTGTGAGGEAAGDGLSGIENLVGSAHADSLTGSAEANLLSGLSGDDVLGGGDGADVLVGGAGADTLDGGMGEDLADYSGSDAGVVVDLRAGTGAGGEAAGDWLDGVDHVLGSLFDDQLLGQDGWGNLLSGGFGNDVLDGRSGADTLIGGAGDDALTGGADADVFGFAGAIGHDVISDFESGVDVISFAAEDEDFADGVSVLQAAEQVGEHVLIRLDDARSLTLANTQLTSLSDADFRIAA